MSFEWSRWNRGGNTIFVASCAGVLSMFLKWVDVGLASQTGLSQAAFLFLVFYIYPFVMLFKNKPIRKLWGLASSALAVVCAIGYIGSKQVELFGKSVNVASDGAWIFLWASVALGVGVFFYRPFDEKEGGQKDARSDATERS